MHYIDIGSRIEWPAEGEIKLAVAKSKAAKRPTVAAVPVLRDNTFHRAVVDNALIFGVGADVEIACLQAGHSLSSVRAKGEDVQLEAMEALTEVVRLRLSWVTATNLAMNILANGIDSNRLDGAAILEKLAELNAEGTDNED